MKAISIPQPWATLVALGEKQFHSITWQEEYRGPIAIHALNNADDWQSQQKAMEAEFAQVLRKHGITSFEMLPFGMIIAKAELVASHHAAFRMRTLSRQERDFNAPHWRARHMLEFRRVVPLVPPVPSEGGAQVWEWLGDEPEAAEASPAPEEAPTEEPSPKTKRK